MNEALLRQIIKITDFACMQLSDLHPIASRGLAHDHIRLGETPWIARIPRGNQLGMDADEYLDLQYSIYERMEPSGVTPKPKGLIRPSKDLPNGALIIEYINGRAVKDVNDLPAIAKSLAELHKMPIPGEVKPLSKAEHPLAGQTFLLHEVFNDAFNSNAVSEGVRALMKKERADIAKELETLMAQNDAPFSLVGGDSHLGNYLIDDIGKAWLVDLEFAAYDLALVDLADAFLNITSQLDPTIQIMLSDKDRGALYNVWAECVGSDFAKSVSDFMPLTERMVNLRTVAWLGYWVSEGREKEKNKVSSDTLENWDKMATHYLEYENLKRFLGRPSQSHSRCTKNSAPKL